MKTSGLPKAGDILSLKEATCDTFVRPLLFLLDSEALDNVSKDVYHHQIVAKNSYKSLPTGSIVMVVHFFADPQYIRYVTPEKNPVKITNKYIKTNNSQQPGKGTVSTQADGPLPKDLKGYIAYVLHEERLWATDVFESMHDFCQSYEVISCQQNK